MMKKLVKVFMFIVVCNLMYNFTMVGYVSFSIIEPSFKSCNIEFKDLIKPHLSTDKYNKLEKSINENALKQSSLFGKKLESISNSLFPNYTETPSYQDNDNSKINETSEIIDKASSEGLKNGLDNLSKGL